MSELAKFWADLDAKVKPLLNQHLAKMGWRLTHSEAGCWQATRVGTIHRVTAVSVESLLSQVEQSNADADKTEDEGCV